MQVFTSASTLVFNTFACDNAVGDGTSYLRADYSISCDSSKYKFFKGYAMLMVLVRTGAAVGGSLVTPLISAYESHLAE